MTTEQKAEAYDNALKKAHKFKEAPKETWAAFPSLTLTDGEAIAEWLFPELKETEDEKMRRRLIDFLKSKEPWEPQTKEYVVWLEKQHTLIEEYEDKLDRCACKYYNKGYQDAKNAHEPVFYHQVK